MIKWFVCNNEEVSGPFSTEKVHEMSDSGIIHSEFLIWSCAQKEWSTLRRWQKEVPSILKDYKISVQKQLQPWYYAHKGESFGPFPKDQLIEEIQQVDNKQAVTLWTKDMPSWKSIFEFNDIIKAVGLNRRAHPRADIDGTVVTKVDGQSHISKLKTISLGGCGITEAPHLSVGQRMHLEIQSEHFFSPLKAIAEVRYISQSGYVGIKFEQIHMESQSTIIEYIKNLEIQPQAA